ncbi:IS1595 family transposase [Mannheimia sp. AT1]|uniref:IS1595 family transposase n=1 Tax=Mannheimia cairinae TaxID=3025936 RepID=A0ABT5MRF1_9PAST|nr:IS1595 family transposase [Mannheimia cairinae]MDD0824761.1 IS1595 family transposase [Mannheimia cairinae]MDD0826309.1 IS1595 family transposase [Mannheimia cairinae]UWZ92803.1 IS1595 family transposase [[Pasteurella] aerogenes]
MAQHFLLTSKARTLSPIKIARLSDDEAFDLLCQLRWGSKENVVCPKCGIAHKAYFISTRKQWRCKYCNHTFSITSGSIFANRKKSLQTYLYIIAKFVNAAKGISSLQLSRDADVNYRTAFVLSHKIRKALLETRDLQPLSGEIDMDGTYVHPAPRKANKKSDRLDYRLAENQNPDKRCIIVAREHYATDEKQENVLHCGAKRSLVMVAKTESQPIIHAFATRFVKANSRINTDESHAYEVLLPHYHLQTVNHKEMYRSDLGVTNNQAESFFSRFKRMYYGQTHKMSNTYLLNYANEIAYREDNRRKSNGWQFNDILGKCLHTTNKNNEWCGYWQRKIIHQEVVWQ